MRLYSAGARSGDAIISIRKPEPMIDVPPLDEEEKEYKASMFPYITEAGKLMSREEYTYYWWHFHNIGLYGYGLVGTSLYDFIVARINLIAAVPLYQKIAGVAIVLGLIYLGAYVLDVQYTTKIREYNYGTGWLMRYESRVWWAEYAGFMEEGSPVFRKLGEIGDIIGYEYRRDMKKTYLRDRWIHAAAAWTLKWTFPFWEQNFWWESENRYYGLMVHINQDFYMLRKEYEKIQPEYWWL